MQVYRFLQTVAMLAVIFWRDVKKQILLPYVISQGNSIYFLAYNSCKRSLPQVGEGGPHGVLK